MRQRFHTQQRGTAQPPVCAIVLNWNRPEETLGCLDSLLPFIRRRQLALVVVDNASTDTSVDQLSAWGTRHFHWYKQTTTAQVKCDRVGWDFLLIRNSENLGYAVGNNTGIETALKRQDIEYIWILNNDTTIDDRALDHLLNDAARNPAVGIFGSTIVRPDSPNFVQCAGGCRYYPTTTITRNVFGWSRLDRIAARSADVRLDYVSGAALFCRTELLRRIGLFDERFFLYYEDTDLCRRAHAAGYTLKWCPGSIVRHQGGVSTGSTSKADWRQLWLSSYHENLSTLLYTRKHHPRLYPLAAALRFLGKSMAYLCRRHFGLFPALVAAYRDVSKGTAFPAPSATRIRPTELELRSGSGT